MLLRRVGMDNTINYRKVKVYDVEKKQLIGEFETAVAASRATGVPASRISRLIANKSKNRTNKLGLVLAFR